MYPSSGGEIALADASNLTSVDVDNFALKLINKIYPVGAIYMSVENINPEVFIGGTWKQLKDTFLLAHGDNYTSTASSNITQVTAESGSATHTLTVAEMPTHTHRVRTTNGWSGNAVGLNWNAESVGIGAVEQNDAGSYFTNTTSGGQALEDTGGGSAHNNMPPYLVVYMWKRTA